MKSLKPLISKRSEKSLRERDVLFGLIECYIKTGKPIGSNSLKETGFDHLSAATIRNYFAKLEEEGFLCQQHTSGGRIPTGKAFKLYAELNESIEPLSFEIGKEINAIKGIETKEITYLIHKSMELLSTLIELPVFISAPRFERDFVIDIKILPLDHQRCLCVLITNFGSIQTEVVYVEQKIGAVAAKRIEAYCQARVRGQTNLDAIVGIEEEVLANKIYNEIMVRFLVSYTHLNEEDLIRTGFSSLLKYNEFRDPEILASSLSLFENNIALRHLLRHAMAHKGLRYWIGDELNHFSVPESTISVMTIPYLIHNQAVGALGIIGPMRMPYPKLANCLKAMSQALSESLTKNLYKFSLNFKQPDSSLINAPTMKRIEHYPVKLIEEKQKRMSE